MRTRIFLVKSNDKVPPCPICNHDSLEYRDSRSRIRKKEGGIKEHLHIRRFKCSCCGTLHNELPDCLVPHKHYDAETISGCIDGVVTADDLDSEDYPCVATLQRWLTWFNLNLNNIAGQLYKVLSSIRDDIVSGLSLLDDIRRNHNNWFEIIHRIIYNSGGWIEPLCHFY